MSTENRTKVCTKCGEEKPLSKFHKDRTKSSGHVSKCKKCKKIYRKKYYENHRKQEIENARRRMKGNELSIQHYKYHYNRQKKSKITKAIATAKRRGYGFNLICPIPDEWDGSYYCFHHINNSDVVAVSKKIHNKYRSNNTETHREKMKNYIRKVYGDIV